MNLVNSILSSFKREILEVARDRLYMAVLIVIPVAMVLFFAVMFYRGEIEDLPIAIVDHSHTQASYKLVNMIDATPGVAVTYNVQSTADAYRLILQGDALAMLYIPDDFEANIYRGILAKVECYLLGTNISADGVIERDVQQTVMTLSAGISLNKLQSEGIGYSEALVEITPVNIHSNIVANPYLNYGYYLAPIFMFMTVVILTVVCTTYAIGRELRYATATKWLEASGNSLAGALMGKLLPITIIMSLMTQFILLILIVFMGMNCAGSYLFLTVGGILFIIAYQAVAIAIVSVTANLRLALSLGGGYAVMAFTFSGITFPVSAMYEWIQPLSKLFPLSYFSDIFIDQMMIGTPLSYDIPKAISLLLFLPLIAISWRRLSRVVRDETYWRRS